MCTLNYSKDQCPIMYPFLATFSNHPRLYVSQPLFFSRARKCCLHSMFHPTFRLGPYRSIAARPATPMTPAMAPRCLSAAPVMKGGSGSSVGEPSGVWPPSD